MTVEIKEEIKIEHPIEIMWRKWRARIKKGVVEMEYPVPIPSQQFQLDCFQSLEGAIAFLTAIQNALKANAPAPEKKPRKTRSDAGKPKKDKEVVLPENLLDKPHLEIHGPDSKGIFTAEFGGTKTWGESLRNAVRILRSDFGNEWPSTMSYEDIKKANDLIEGKKP